MSETCLLVDIGNSRLKWNLAAFNSDAFKQQTRTADHHERSVAEVLDHQWGSINAPYPAVSIVNVAGPSVAQQVTDWCVSHWDVNPRFMITAERFGNVVNGYQDHTQLGADRWMAVIAANHLHPGQHNVIIDCGSAITVDTVMADGQHRGGPIIPGPGLMWRALAGSTADLGQYRPTNELSAEAFVNNSQAAMTSGINLAASKAVDGIIHQICDKLSQSGDDTDINILVTGGAAGQIMPLTEITDYTPEPDLVLHGLRIVTADQ
ncbi:MAG: type III pantothenate kinase [Gammaproteobacteria bacterium]|jgi:type III pantothenate kinase